MKKILLGILAFAAVACNNDVVVQRPASSAITFGDSFIENKTRAAEDPSFHNENNPLKAFDVWGYMDKTTGTVFDKTRVKYDESLKKWTYSPLQYWMVDLHEHNYYFYAVAPVDNTDITVNKALNGKGLGTIDFVNTNGTVDLLYAEKHVAVTSGAKTEVIKLQFAHLLSKIKFTFKNNFPEGGYNTLEVKNITISEAPSKGTVTLNDDTRSWTFTGNDATLAFGNVNGGVALNPTEEGESDFERLTIPAADNVRYKITFEMTLYQGTEVGMESRKEIYLEGQEFVMGKNYNIVVPVDASNFAEDALKEIEFTVEVVDWEENNFEGNLDWDNDQNNPSNPSEPSEPVASEWALVGAFSSWADKTMLTTADADVVVLEDVALKAAEGFLVRKPSTDWADKYGAGNVNYLKANHYITTVKEGADMCVEADGTYDVYFNISTKNLYVMEADANYAEATEQTVNGEEPKQEEPEVTEKVVYLKPNANWTTDGARFAAYFWINDTTNAWVSMTAIEDGIYQVNLPEGYDYGCNVIFCRMNPNTTANNWNNKWNQTGDLKVPTDGKNLFTLAESAWDGATTSWSVYTPAVVEPVALATPVVTAVAKENTVTLSWEPVENAAQYSITVGTEMPVFVEETTYVFTGEYETEYTFNVVAVPEDEEKFAASEAGVAIATTEAEPVVGPTYTTVAEFLAAPVDPNTYYYLKGTITNVVNTSYGNFDLMDETGTVYVYGLYSEDGSTSKYWATSGAKLADDIVIYAVRSEFNGSAQAGSARFVELTSPGTRAFWSFSKDNVVFGSAEAAEQTVNVEYYNTTDAIVASSNNDHFTASYANGVVTIATAENTTYEKIEGVITVTCGNLSKDITVSQAAMVDPDDEIVAGEQYSYTFTKTVFSANGTKALGDLNWTIAGDGGYWGWDSNGKGQQFGSKSKPYTSLTMSTEDYTEGVETITINTAGASNTAAKLEVYVGDTKLGQTVSLTSTSTDYTFSNNGEVLTGKIELRYTQTSKVAIYIKAITIN